MALYINDKDVVESVDINYILDYFKSKGETCIRIMYGRGFRPPHGKKDYILGNSLIIEPLLVDKPSYIYQDGCRTLSIDRESGSICVNPYFDKSGNYERENSLAKELQEYILDYTSYQRDKKINEII